MSAAGSERDVAARVRLANVLLQWSGLRHVVRLLLQSLQLASVVWQFVGT